QQPRRSDLFMVMMLELIVDCIERAEGRAARQRGEEHAEFIGNVEAWHCTRKIVYSGPCRAFGGDIEARRQYLPFGQKSASVRSDSDNELRLIEKPRPHDPGSTTLESQAADVSSRLAFAELQLRIYSRYFPLPRATRRRTTCRHGRTRKDIRHWSHGVHRHTFDSGIGRAKIADPGPLPPRPYRASAWFKSHPSGTAGT